MTARWWSPSRGDIDATIAQVGFNLAQLVIPVFLLIPAGIGLDFSVSRMLPGYALGFLVGSLGMCSLALNLARRENRTDVTVHVYGNNVPAIIAFTLSIVLPVFLETHDPLRAWEVGAAAVTWTGLIKLAAAPFARAIRRLIPAPASMTVFGAAMYSYLALVLLQRIFDEPLVGVIALAIVATCVLANVPITRARIPPFLVAWIVPLVFAILLGYVKPAWPGLSPRLPFAITPEPLQGMLRALPYFSVIAPMAIYQVLQDIASVAGASAAGDEYDARGVLFWDGLGTLVCGLAGSIVAPVVYAMHPPYKAMGARIAFGLWAPILFAMVVMGGLTTFIAQLFPWPILAAMIAYVSIGVGAATIRRVDPKYLSVVLLGFVLPTGAVVSTAISSALNAIHVSPADPRIADSLERAVYWSSLQGLGNGFLFLVLVVAALVTELIDRRFGRAALWCLLAAAFSWVGLLHSTLMRWGAQPRYAKGWLLAAAIVYSAKWWNGEVPRAQGTNAK